MARFSALNRDPADGTSFRNTTLAAIVYQGVITLYQLLIPAVIARQYDGAVLGIWFTLYSLHGLGMALNLGMPGALLSRIDGRPQGDRELTARQIGSALSLTVRVSALWLLFAIAASLLPIDRWIDAPRAAGSTSVLSAIFAGATALMLAANLAQPLYVALFRGFQAYLVATIVHVVALPCVVAVALLKPDFAFMAALFLAPPLCTGLLLWAIGFRRGYFALTAGDRPTRTALLTVGMPFLAMDAATALVLRTPEVVLSDLHGFVAAGQFSAFQRFPFLLSALLAVVLQPAWPALSAAARESDGARARLLIGRLLRLTLLLWVAFAVCVLPLGELLMRRWLGENVAFSQTTLLLAIAFGLAQSLHYWTALSLVGLDDRRANLRISVLMLLSYVLSNYAMTKYFGSTGTYLTLLFVFGAVGAPLGFFALRARLRTMRRAESGSP